MAATVDELRLQHRHACDKIVQRLELKSSRGEGPNRVLRKILKHFDKTEGQLLLSADDFMQAMERIGTKLSPSDLDLLLTVYSADGTGFDGHRFASDLFGEGGAASTIISESGLIGGVFSPDNTPRAGPPRQRMSSNAPSLPGGPLTRDMPPPEARRHEPHVAAAHEEANEHAMAAAYHHEPPTAASPPAHKKQSNDSSIPGGIFGMAPEATRGSKRGSRTNVSSIPGGARRAPRACPPWPRSPPGTLLTRCIPQPPPPPPPPPPPGIFGS